MSIFTLPCPHNDDKECKYCKGIAAQDGWRFRGCFCSPFKGKFIRDIKECPKKKQKGEQV